MSFKARLVGLLLADLRAAEVSVAWCGLFAGLALTRLHFVGVENISVYVLALAAMLPLGVWGAGFIIYAGFRVATSLGYIGRRLRLFICISGMMLWASVFTAGTLLQTTPSGLAFLYCVPAAFEVWALTQALAVRYRHG